MFSIDCKPLKDLKVCMETFEDGTGMCMTKEVANPITFCSLNEEFPFSIKKAF